MRRLALFASLLGTTTLLACTATVSDPKPDAGTPLADAPDAGPAEITLPESPTLAQLSAWWDATILCRLYACEQHLRQTPATCERALAAKGDPYDTFRTALASVEAGRATYDAEAGKRCATFLRTIDLSGECFGESVVSYRDAYGIPFVTLCTDLVDGTVAGGGACDHERECVAGAGCVFDRNAECAGECLVWLKAGESCAERWQDCGPGTYCDGAKCRTRQLAPEGASCFDDGASCESGKCFDYRCRTVSPLNGECVAEGDCVQGLYCKPLPPSTGRLGICAQPVLAGEPCGYTTRCAGNQSCSGYFWKYDAGWSGGTCTEFPGDVGDRCVPIPEGYDHGDTGCYADLSCDPETSTCEVPPAIGRACAMPGRRCGLDAYCDADGTCRAKKAAGEAASGPGECLDGYESWSGKCAAPPAHPECAF